MVRGFVTGFTVPPRFPHARGDGPSSRPASPACSRFSPRPWGWSVLCCCYVQSEIVFPTPVGMVRNFSSSSEIPKGFPHARGDGPHENKNALRNRRFSPRPWGWSDDFHKQQRFYSVFPTPVGMVLEIVTPHRSQISFPHARGDGPYTHSRYLASKKFSPRPWGWSADVQRLPDVRAVFPTPVGMVR